MIQSSAFGRLSLVNVSMPNGRMMRANVRSEESGTSGIFAKWACAGRGYLSCRKKRTISRLASGPRGSVYEPLRLPPDQV
jgi:hypothetical protein